MSLMDPALYQQQMLAERTRQSTSFLSQVDAPLSPPTLPPPP